MKFLKFKNNPIFLAIIIFVFAFSVFYGTISSSTNDNLFGYAWGSDWTDLDNNSIQNLPNESSGGVGWISFNCLNEDGSCNEGNNYGVNINETTGDVTGYAWSPNYGWLKFGGLSGFPSGGETISQNAKFNGTVISDVFNGNLSGWARFCSVASNPEACSGFYENDQNGGWDGWVSLSGTSPNYGVSINNNVLSGYAWGGDDNGKNIIGWLDLTGVNIQNNQKSLDFYPLPLFASSPNFNTTLHWRSLDDTVFTSCNAESGNPLNPSIVPLWNGPVSSEVPQSLQVTVPYNSTKYRLTCLDALNNSHSQTITVTRNLDESLSLNNTRVIGGLTTLSWTARNMQADSCVASTVNPDSGLNWSLSNPKTPPTSTDTSSVAVGSMTGVSVTSALPQKTTYRLTCIGKYSLQPVTVSLDLHTLSGSSTFTNVPKYIEN